MLMREADSLNNRKDSGAAVKSFSITVPLISMISDQGHSVAGRRPPGGKQGVSSP